MTVKDIFLAVFVALAWGSYFTISKMAFSSFPPLFLSGLRFFLLFLFTSPFLLKEKIPIKKTIYLSIIIFLNLVLINYAIFFSSNLVPIILINQLTVPISVLIGIYCLKEKFYLKDMIGIGVSLIGVAVVIKFRSIDNVSTFSVLLAIAASFLFAVYNLFTKELAKYNILVVIANMSLFLFPQFFLLSFYQESWPSLEAITLAELLTLLYIVIIISLVSDYLWFYLLNKYSMNKVVPFLLLVPIFGCFITAWVFDEQISNEMIVGGLAVILGIVLIELKVNHAKQKL